jgi:hypothetical protein
MEFFIEPKNIMLWNILIYFLINGSQIFETLVFIPKWTDNAPNNFNLILDKPGVSLKSFWTIFHSIHEIIFIITIIVCWNLPFVKLWLIILFTLHFAVRVWTILYFAPAIIRFQKIATESESDDNRISEMVLRWKQLNALRVILFILISLALVPLYFTLI